MAEPTIKVSLKRILFLTDFSAPSQAALPFALALARENDGTLYALHVSQPSRDGFETPDWRRAMLESEEKDARSAMGLVESQLSGLSYEAIVEEGTEVWPTADRAIRNYGIDIAVLGTHGRTGAEKLLLGSVAEEIFRRSPVPVLTIGPHARGQTLKGGHFHRILFATDFTPASVAAAPYALSFTKENRARFILLHVSRRPSARARSSENEDKHSVAETMQRLYNTIPEDSGLELAPEVIVEYGEPADRIVAAAEERGADLVVLGVRSSEEHLEAATHLERTTAHKVVAHATCPVLTVRH